MRRRMSDGSSLGASAFFRQAAHTLVSAGVAAGLALTLAACANPQIVTPDTGEAASAAPTSGEQTAAPNAADGADAPSEATTDGTEAYLSAAKAFSIDDLGLFSERDGDAGYDEASACKIALKDAGSTVEGKGATVSGGEVKITAAGTYVISGSLSDGRIVVDVPDTEKVQLVLSGASVASSGPSALYVRSADKVFCTLADGTKNVLASTGAEADEDGRTLDGTVFAADDLTINGAGALVVTSASGSGVVAKDELTVCGGTLDVDAARHAIEAKDSFAAREGTLTLKAKKDGINVSHETNGEKGFVLIAGGTFAIEAEDDGINATNDVRIDGGTVRVRAGDDGIHSDFDLVLNDGTIEVLESTEGLEGARVVQNGGTVAVSAKDDGVNATGDPTTAELAGEGKVGEGGSGQSRGEAQDMRPQMHEKGFEGRPQDVPEDMPEAPEPPEGDFALEGGAGESVGAGQGDGTGRQGEGIAHRGSRPQGADGAEMPDFAGKPEMAGRQGMGGGFEADESASIEIRGGQLTVDAGGDGLDSNGSIEVFGGETYVSGPTNDGNGALDYGTSATVNGGTFVATGSSGMAQGFGSESTQGSMLVSLAGNADDTITLCDATGSVLATHTPTKSFACILVSAPGIRVGNAYTLSNGTDSKSVTMDSLSYSDVSGPMGGAPFGGGGGHRIEPAAGGDTDVAGRRDDAARATRGVPVEEEVASA